MNKSIGELGKLQGTAAAYLSIARLDHSTKHIFIVPGIMLAYLLRGVHTPFLAKSIVLGLIAAICIASANYVGSVMLGSPYFRAGERLTASVARSRRGG